MSQFSTINLKTGATLDFSMLLKAGDFSDVTGITSDIRAVNEKNEPTGNPIASAQVTPDETNNRWGINYDSDATAGIDPGRYVMDVRVEASSVVIFTETVFVDIEQGVTGNGS